MTQEQNAATSLISKGGGGEKETNSDNEETINIIGCCVSREIFNVHIGYNYQVTGHILRNSMLNILDKGPEPRMKIDIDFIRKYTSSAFDARNISFLINGGARNFLESRKGKWLIIDTYYTDSNLRIIEYENGEKRIISSDIPHIVDAVIKDHPAYKKCKITKVDASLNTTLLVKNFCKYVKSNWGKNVILINCPGALSYLDKNGIIIKKDRINVEKILSSIELRQQLINNLNCYEINIPYVTLGDYYNAWHASDVHYISEIYDYLKKAVDIIIHGASNKKKQLKLLELDLEKQLFGIINGYYISERNAKIRAETIIKEKKYSQSIECYELCKKLMEMNKASGYALLGKMYMGDFFGKPDINECFCLYEEAIKIDNNYLNEYCDLLLRTSKTQYQKRAVELLKSNEGDVGSTYRLGKIYRDGIIVNKNLELAAELFKKAADQGFDISKIDYFNALWTINTKESLEKMIKYGEEESSKGNMEIRARLGRAYRDGIGVKRNLQMAANLMKGTIDSKPQWSKWEYIDILWAMNNKESDKEVYDYSLIMAETGNKEFQARLARCYRYGRGTNKDLEKSSQLMRKAADQGLGWAKLQLFDILWEIGTEESYNESFMVAQSFANQGDGASMGRLARCYRDGRGTGMDLKMAAHWMKKATEKNIPWAKYEYDEILKKIDCS